MGKYLTFDDLREQFAKPLARLAVDLDDLCDRWEEASKAKKITRQDLLLNEVTAESALGSLRRFHREASGKLEDAVAGVYRYRDVERKRSR